MDYNKKEELDYVEKSNNLDTLHKKVNKINSKPKVSEKVIFDKTKKK